MNDINISFISADSISNQTPSDTTFLGKDTTTTGNDSTFIADSLAQDTTKLDPMAIDSTARLKYFRFQREDKPIIELGLKRGSKFFLPKPETVKKRTIAIDSTGKFVIVKEAVSVTESKVLVRIPIEEYINMRLSQKERNLWEDIGYAYELKESERGLGELIKDITDFEIPLPSVGVLSIFGEPKISLKIGGAVDIHGAWRSETTEGVTASRLGNTRNEPDFKQQVQINVSGTIGDKLNINADWNTERTFEYENQLKIKYTGYEDEIIQSIEAGNVSLQTSPLVGGSEALFGVKANFKMGPLSLTTLASQKKGEIKELSVSGGSTSQTFEKRAYEYSTNHYFIDTIYQSSDRANENGSNLFERYYSPPTPDVENFYLIKDIEVWKSIQTAGRNPAKERQANAFIDLGPINENTQYDEIWRADTSGQPGRSESSRFLLLTRNEDYTINEYTGVISFRTNIQTNDIIGVAYRIEGDNPGDPDDDRFFGEFISTAQSDTQKLVLKLVKPAGLQPGGNYAQAWKLLLKNIYPVGGRNIKEQGFEFKIKREIEGQEPVEELPGDDGPAKLLQAFGLDKYDASKSGNPDNILDWRPNITIIPETGEIIFPTLQPFGEDIPVVLQNEDSLKFQAVYDTTDTYARQQKTNDKWLLTGLFSGEASSVYQLGFNVVENSVRVTLGGRQLTPGIDYIVDYNIGQVTIRNDAALIPGADLKITYEQNDLFQLASKTLLGARGILDISNKTKLGFSILNLNQQTLSDKVRIGEEPLSNTIYGVDFSTAGDLPFLTKALDNVISTKAMSTFTLAGEYAYISPDPNTKKSTIVSDKGKSIAYIDDFEGAKRIIPVGVSYTGWKDISPPDGLPGLSGLGYRALMPFKGKSFWWTATPSGVKVEDIWGSRKKVRREDEDVTVMDYVFMPDTPGTYNWVPQLQDRQRNWGGIMRVLSSTANNLIEENVEFIEFWIQVGNAPPGAKVYIDLGRISEDVIPNNKLDTEDKPPYNDLIDTDGNEDTGLDGWTDDQERDPSVNTFLTEPSTKADPSGDNFFFVGGSSLPASAYFNINGTQGNAVLTDIGRLPDTEDLNRNGNINTINSYFRYEVPLDTNASTNRFIAGGGDNAGWYLYRIPLKDTAVTVGEPTFSNVEFIRFFITGADQTVHLRFAEFNLVGSQWQKVLPEDTVMSVSVISFEDNPDYRIPPGVIQERDRTDPNQEVLRNEQSLNLIINNLPDGQSREAVRYLYKPLDVFNYREMKLFVHGDLNTFPGSVSYNDSLHGLYSSEVYFRFGTDTNNYYEYRQPVKPDWNEVSIVFSDLTAIKQARDSISILQHFPVTGQPGHFYGIKGNPSLISVKFLTIGIYNTDDPDKPFSRGGISGEIWVNELRVIGADDSPGWAYSFSSSLRFADLMTVNFNMSRTNPYFHKLADRFGSRNESTNWGTSMDLDIIKLLPISLPESNLKLNYSHTESVGKPLYIPGTDVKVDEAANRIRESQSDTTITSSKTPEQIISESQSVNVSNTWSSSNIKLKIPSSYWLIRDSFNALTFGFNYNTSFSRSPTVLNNRNWIWNANMNYGINLSPEYFFYPAKIPVVGTIFALFSDYRNAKVYYAPQNFTFNATAKRMRNRNVTRPQLNTTAQEVISRDFTTTRGFNFSWKVTEGGFLNLSTSYNVNILSSLAHLEIDSINGRPVQRLESEIWKDIFSGAFFGRDYSYQQSVDFRTSPKLPTLWDINKYFTITASYTSSYQWSNDFRQVILGRAAGYANSSKIGLQLRLKALAQPLFTEESSTNTQQTKGNLNSNTRGRNRTLEEEKKTTEIPADTTVINPDSLQTEDSLQVESTVKSSPIKNALLFFRTVAKSLFFDYESITFNFSSDNNLSKSGILGEGTGFNNFWGIGFKDSRGPSRSFMFGLSSDVGRRAPGGNLQDVFSQKNNFDFKTSRPLWEGAKIDLNWKVGWSLNKSTTIQTDEFGNTHVTNITSTGTIDRSFLSLPPVLLFSVFKSGIKQVSELYDPDATNKTENLSNAFVQGFESFPVLSKLSFLNEFTKYIPRPNWRISWDGLESFFLFKAFAKKVSLNHEYRSTYTEGWKINPAGTKEIQTQKIEYGFSPLAGFNFTFGELWGGNMISSIKYSTRTNYDLGKQTKSITETFSRDIGITAGYSKSGFEIPLFGISLKNDIEFSFSYTSTKNSTILFDMENFTEEGTPQDGTTRVTMEPRIKYTISSKVTLSIFYRRSSVEPEGAARIPPTTTNEAGLDVHISIQ